MENISIKLEVQKFSSYEVNLFINFAALLNCIHSYWLSKPVRSNSGQCMVLSWCWSTKSHCFGVIFNHFHSFLGFFSALCPSDATSPFSSTIHWYPCISIFQKFLGPSLMCTEQKVIVTCSISPWAVKQLHDFFNTSSSWQDWTKLHHYVLQCKRMAWAIPTVSSTHFSESRAVYFCNVATNNCLYSFVVVVGVFFLAAWLL